MPTLIKTADVPIGSAVARNGYALSPSSAGTLVAVKGDKFTIRFGDGARRTLAYRSKLRPDYFSSRPVDRYQYHFDLLDEHDVWRASAPPTSHARLSQEYIAGTFTPIVAIRRDALITHPADVEAELRLLADYLRREPARPGSTDADRAP